MLVYSKNKIIAWSIFLFLIIDYIQFYAIKPIVWGAGKYQAEYVIPFTIVGFFLFLYYVAKKRYLNISVCILFTIVNTYVFKNIYNFNKSPNDLRDSYYSDLQKPFGGLILSEMIFPYKGALIAASNVGYGANVFLYGLTYGVFPQILVGYTVKDVIASYQNAKLLKGYDGGDLIKRCNDNDKIKLLLLCNAPSDLSAINYLKSNGWVAWKTFYDKKHKSRIISLIRNSEL